VPAYGRARSLTDDLQLANGLSMPTIHLGVYMTSGKETYQAVRWALEVYFLLFLA
jgi:diketogulonate reductase-like aldo/keto reductase